MQAPDVDHTPALYKLCGSNIKSIEMELKKLQTRSVLLKFYHCVNSSSFKVYKLIYLNPLTTIDIKDYFQGLERTEIEIRI